MRRRLTDLAVLLTTFLLKLVPGLTWRHIEPWGRSGKIFQLAEYYLFATAFGGRHLDFFDGLEETDEKHLGRVGFLWKTKLIHYRGHPVNEVADLARLNASAVAQYGLFSGQLVRTAITNFLMLRRADEVIGLLKVVEPSPAAYLSHREIIGVYKFILGTGVMTEPTEIRKLLGVAHHDVMLQLKLLDVAAYTRTAGIGWREVFRELIENVSSDRQRAQLRCACAQTQRLVDRRRDLLELRSDPSKMEEFQGHLLDALTAKTPLSLLRLGDGEAYSMYLPDASEALSSHQLRERHWWGKTLGPEQRAEIGELVRNAIEDADLLCIPSAYRFARDVEPAIFDMNTSRATRDLLTVMTHLDNVEERLSATMILEDRVNIHGFSRSFLSQLAHAADKIVILSCWRSSQLALDLPKDCIDITIPGQMKTSINENGAPRQRLCDIFHGVADDVSQHASPGTLVLVSAGILGKIFVNRASRQGAIALDIGSTLDYYAGRMTRDPADLL